MSKNVKTVLQIFHGSMGKNVVLALRDYISTVLLDPVKNVVLAGNGIRKNKYANALRKDYFGMANLAFLATIQTFLTSLIENASSVLKVKSMILSKRNASSALLIILTLMERNALNALKIHYGILLNQNVLPAKMVKS